MKKDLKGIRNRCYRREKERRKNTDFKLTKRPQRIKVFYGKYISSLLLINYVIVNTGIFRKLKLKERTTYYNIKFNAFKFCCGNSQISSNYFDVTNEETKQIIIIMKQGKEL